MFEQVCDVVDPGAENPRKRATHAIQRLREQRLLVRVDGAGIVRAGEYTLTRLAAAIVEYFLTDEALTRESLTLLTGILRAQLAEILAAARKAEGEDAWRTTVSGSLRVTVSGAGFGHRAAAARPRRAAGRGAGRDRQAALRRLVQRGRSLPDPARDDDEHAERAQRNPAARHASLRRPAAGDPDACGRGLEHRRRGGGPARDRARRSDRGVGRRAAASVVRVLPVRAPLPSRRGAARPRSRAEPAAAGSARGLAFTSVPSAGRARPLDPAASSARGAGRTSTGGEASHRP